VYVCVAQDKAATLGAVPRQFVSASLSMHIGECHATCEHARHSKSDIVVSSSGLAQCICHLPLNHALMANQQTLGHSKQVGVSFFFCLFCSERCESHPHLHSLPAVGGWFADVVSI